MPTGSNPNSKKNLKRGNPEAGFNTRNASEAGRRSAEVRRERKTWREATREAVTPEVMEQIIATAIQQSIDGNANARDFLRDTMGEKPSDSVEINGGATAFNVNIRVVD